MQAARLINSQRPDEIELGLASSVPKDGSRPKSIRYVLLIRDVLED